MAITSNALKSFLQDHVEPLEDSIYGKRYRASARLTDGTNLPCVVFQSQRGQIDLALRRFKQLASRPEEYKQVVASFVSKGSHLADWTIESVETSPYAWPVSLLKTIKGETAMSWTSFVAEMKDGSLHSFGTSFLFEFFELPEGYTHADIKNIQGGMVFSPARGLTPYSPDALNGARVYRERPFFTCYLECL